MSIRLGKLTLSGGIMLAPMAGYSDRAMRKVCHDCGAELSFTEMVSARAVTFEDKKTSLIAGIRPDEGSVALQIFGNDPDIMARAVSSLQWGRGEPGYSPPVAIDINMGCPVNKIYGNGEGSALMKSPELIEKIVRSVVGSTDLPVTVKMRRGVDRDSENAVECALAAESGGASMVTVHGRFKSQLYGGTSDLDIIKRVKSALLVPVVANGDIVDAKTALEAFSYTGCDGVMIGRGAVGNPFIFEEISAAMKGEAYTPPTIEERIRVSLLQLSLAVEDKGERVAVTEARKQIALYFKGRRGSAELRARINTALTYREVERAIEESIEL